MISFVNDYSETAHPRVLAAIGELSGRRFAGYGADEICEEARELIRRECASKNADIHFFTGGTQTNLTLVSAALRPHEGVISAATAHVNVHETGAIEATGHKVLTIPSPDGKLNARAVAEYYDANVSDENFEHIVKPGMVYISDPTELGTVYTLAELEELSRVCRERGLTFYIDGARLSCALDASDASLADLARLADAFYIGGAKLGALFGEALVINAPALKREFRYIQKQKGALASKSFVIGAQFRELFRDGLYYEIGRRENALARRLADSLEGLGVGFLAPAATNQVFPALPDSALEYIRKDYAWSFWEKTDETHTAVRFCVGFETEPEEIDGLAEAIRKGINK